MKNTERIVHLLRTNPDGDITALVEEDASSVTAKVVSTTHIPLIRQVLIEFVRSVHLASALVVKREHKRRTTAELDAAQSRALLAMANRRLVSAGRLFKDLEGMPVEADEIPDMIKHLTELLKPATAPKKGDRRHEP